MKGRRRGPKLFPLLPFPSPPMIGRSMHDLLPAVDRIGGEGEPILCPLVGNEALFKRAIVDKVAFLLNQRSTRVRF